MNLILSCKEACALWAGRLWCSFGRPGFLLVLLHGLFLLSRFDEDKGSSGCQDLKVARLVV